MEHAPQQFLQLILWGSTIGTTAALVGLIVAAKEKEVLHLLEQQNSLALMDQLTQISNRRAFDLELRRKMAEFHRHDRKLAVLVIDIDYFKKFNDRYGHAVGDIVLKTIAQTIQECLREADLASRFGGEEFAVLLPDTNIDEANVVAERIRNSVDQISESEVNCPQKVSVSIGLTELDTFDNEQSVLKRADIAMYAAKRNGRNNVFSNCIKEFGSELPIDPLDESKKVVAAVFDEAQAMPSSVDTVTGLTYLQIFDHELTRRIYESARYDMELCLGLIELACSPDAEKTKSHVCSQVGNIARTVRESLRESDVVTWFSELEFGILMPFTKIDNGTHVLRRLFMEINTDLILTEENPLFHVQSIRIVQLENGDTKKQILKKLRSVLPLEVAELDVVCAYA